MTTKRQKLALLEFKRGVAERSGNTTLEFKRTTSRGRETYGYNIVSLYADGQKVAGTCGGGYDMRGSVLGEYIQSRFQYELQKIADQAHATFDHDRPGSYKTRSSDAFDSPQKRGLYGMCANYKQGSLANVTLDGSCGFSSMEAILKAIGYHLSNLKTQNRDIYLLGKDGE